MAVFNDRGHICAFGVSSYDTSPIWKYNDERLLYCSDDIFSNPVLESKVPPVAA